MKRHVTEDIVKDVGFFKIVELLAAADEGSGRKFAAGKHLKEWARRDEAGNCNHLPAGDLPQARIHAVEIGYGFSTDAERREPIEVLLGDMTTQRSPLTLEKRPPDGMILGGVALPALIDDAVVNSLSCQNSVSSHRLHSLAGK